MSTIRTGNGHITWFASHRLTYEPSLACEPASLVALTESYVKQDRDCFSTQRMRRVKRKWFNKILGPFVCCACGRFDLVKSKEPKSNQITLDHILPISARPDLWNKPENFRVCCYECNIKKSSRVDESLDSFRQLDNMKL
jgi:5-methylcytosine-specific restriction endonuclease McrA